MDLLIKLALYIAIGFFLLAVNAWFFKSVTHTFFTTGSPKVLAPFEITGKPDPDGKIGTMQARHLRATLSKISDDLARSRQILTLRPKDIVKSTDEQNILPRPQGEILKLLMPLPENLGLPRELFNRVDLELSVGGVDVGGVLTWLQHWFVGENVFQVSVEFTENNAKVVGDGSIYLNVSSTQTEDVINQIAYAIIQSEFSKELPYVKNFTLNEFKLFLNTFQRYSEVYHEDLNSLISGRAKSPERYRSLLSNLEQLVIKVPRWRSLVQMAGQVAELVGDIPKAYEYYRMVVAQTDKQEIQYEILSEKLNGLKLQLTNVAKMQPTQPIRTEVPIEDAALNKALLGTEMTRSLLKQVGVTDRVMQGKATIAILGGDPDRQGMTKSDETSTLADYVDTLTQVIKIIAPNSQFEYVELDSEFLTDSQLLPSLDQLISTQPRILLIPIGPLQSPQYRPLFERAASNGTLIIFTAGMKDERVPELYAQMQLTENSMVVSSVSRNGHPSSFAPVDENYYWAPGEDVPVYNRAQSIIEPRRGTGYSAAIATGIAARIVARNPDIELQDLLETLKLSSTKQNTDAQAVLNLSTALSMIETLPVTKGSRIEKEAKVDIKIPDNSPDGLSDSIDVDLSGKLLDIRVGVNITHTYIGDLIIKLIAPGGEEVILHNRTGGALNNLVFSYSSGVVTGLQNLIGQDINGRWTINVSDLSQMDVGKLNSWSMKLNYE